MAVMQSYIICKNQKSYVIPHDGFFQVNDAGAKCLIDAIKQAAGSGQLLVDLYCGVGAIGIALSDQFSHVIGIELHPQAIDQARKNAKTNNLMSSPTRKIQKGSSIKKSSVSNIIWSVRRSIRGGSQLFNKRGGTYRMNENVKENGFIPGKN